jgi:hypothetical protein
MEVKIISSADIEKCPVHSLSAGHYFRTGDEVICQCMLDASDDLIPVFLTQEQVDAAYAWADEFMSRYGYEPYITPLLPAEYEDPPESSS